MRNFSGENRKRIRWLLAKMHLTRWMKFETSKLNASCKTQMKNFGGALPSEFLKFALYSSI
jgi:hypothetical protein